MHPPGELLSFTSLTSTATVEPARSTADAIRILIGESQAIFIAGLKSVLASHPDIDNVGVANSFQMLLRLVAETEPDIVLLDESLLDRRADRLRWLLNSHPNTNVIVEVNSEELAFCLSLLRAGARAVVPRLVAPAQLAQCIQSVAKGSHWISGKVLGWLIDDWQTHRPMRSEVSLELPHFNARETMVMSMIVRGHKNSEMAAHIRTSEQTIKNILSRLYRRLGVSDRKGLRRYCINMGVPAEW